jgi:hypothetical protein
MMIIAILQICASPVCIAAMSQDCVRQHILWP